jgi:predicted negative regulator of RcsB-dependent stress response
VLRAAGDMESQFGSTAYAPMSALVAAKRRSTPTT